MEVTPKAVAAGIPVHCAFTELVPTANVAPNPRNPNKHPDKQIKLLAKIIRQQGWRAPVTVSLRSGLVVRGHGRLLAAAYLGAAEVPVDYQEYASEAEEWADLIADNRIAELASLDSRALVDLIEELDTGFIDVELTGYSEEALTALIHALDGTDDDAPAGEDDLPAIPETPRTKPGDLWLLGHHRLLFGDATSKADLARVTKGEKAHLVFTDPPYGVDYESQRLGKIRNDALADDALVGLLVPALKLAALHSIDTAAFYIWHASATRRDYEHALDMAGLMERQYLIWVKTHAVLGHADYHWSHEPCFYAFKAGHSPNFYGDRAQQTIWRAVLAKTKEIGMTLGNGVVLLDGAGGRLYLAPKAPKGKKTRHIRIAQGDQVYIATDTLANDAWEIARDTQTEHPTQKPVELARRAIENSSLPGDIVLDPFVGSGTTLVAAELTGRRCHAVELDPRWCDVVVGRWERLTGQVATREGEAQE